MTNALPPLRRAVDRSPAAAAGGPLVLLSAALSLLARGVLGPEVRLRWTVEPSYHVGPSVVPAWTVLVGFPAVVAATYLGLVAVGAVVDRAGEAAPPVRTLYAIVVATVLATIVLTQVALVVANLLL